MKIAKTHYFCFEIYPLCYLGLYLEVIYIAKNQRNIII